MADNSMLEDFGSDSEEESLMEEGGKETLVEDRARKKARTAPLHEQHVAPLSFLVDAVEENDGNFNVTGVDCPFGKNKEAYARVCYEDIVREIKNSRSDLKKIMPGRAAMLFVVAGSSGIGKSTFLAYFVVRLRRRFKNIAVCYAPKAARTLHGVPCTDEVICAVWKRKTKIIEGEYRTVRSSLVAELPNLDLIVMDGCSMPFISTERFKGTIIVAASPGLYVKNLKDAIFYRSKDFIMPPLQEKEAYRIAEMLGIANDVVDKNHQYMAGITRYLFTAGAAKTKVDEAVDEVSASRITKMVSMQSSSRDEQVQAVHSLVLWKAGANYRDLSFELVSRYAEQQVAKKLTKETMENLKMARQNMAPLSGAEGYAGALFEAYAIRTLREGGDFTMRSLEEDRSTALKLSRMDVDPVVVEGNALNTAKVPHNSVRIPLDSSGVFFSPRLLWPTTTNLPAFDCFYFHSNGEVFSCQMTIARIHELENSGASDAKNYLDGVFQKKETPQKPNKHRAVFVVPVDLAPGYKKQKFTGTVDQKPANFEADFEQWVIGV